MRTLSFSVDRSNATTRPSLFASILAHGVSAATIPTSSSPLRPTLSRRFSDRSRSLLHLSFLCERLSHTVTLRVESNLTAIVPRPTFSCADAETCDDNLMLTNALMPSPQIVRTIRGSSGDASTAKAFDLVKTSVSLVSFNDATVCV